MAVFIGSEIYRGSSYGAWHPLRIPRVSTVIDLSRALGWLPPGTYRTSPRARPAALHAFHRPDYVAALQRAEAAGTLPPDERRRYHLGTPSNPIFPEVFRRPATAAGGSLLGAETIAPGGGHVFNPGGGTHHGQPGRAAGFCYLNDCVLAILALRRLGRRRVAYLDIDAHHADGVQDALGHDPDTMIVSFHEAGRWPRTGRLDEEGGGWLFNLPVAKGMHDDEAALILERLALPALAAFRPDAVILQCGADAVREDPQSRLALSNQTHVAWVRALRAFPRLLVLGGGGYDPWSVARTWTLAWGALAGLDLPTDLPPEARAVLAALRHDKAGRAVEPAPYLTRTLLDAPRGGPIRDDLRADVARLAGRLRAWA
ncbi:MAG: acetoin utilization protein AcuC [Shimia sp.]